FISAWWENIKNHVRAKHVQCMKRNMFQGISMDGVIGSHQKGVREAEENFLQLALEMADRCNIPVPE
ncbi:MAG TPA: hypothetical protein PLY52_07920, partial [Methanothrix sp.]|uniref:hypothetical protein n=1 Tax=Methanothrix sp. TaxID=90426 RepID=UPI002C38DA2D